MRFNCHTHIFNLQSVFTTRTMETLINRIKALDFPEFVVALITTEMAKVIENAGAYADEENLLRNLIGRLKQTAEYKNIVDDLSDPARLRIEVVNTDNLDRLALGALKEFIQWFSDKWSDAEEDARKKTILDAVEFVRIALLPSIRKVTARLMDQLEDTDAVVALMMDITGEDADQALFESQIQNTSDMVLAYPGRILPFLAVNPVRPGFVGIMEHALQARGFVGVKLYPSLGYDPASDELAPVYRYCEERRIPLTVHCTAGGFYYKEQFRDNSNPDRWQTVLAEFPELRLCFGHFGDSIHLIHEQIDPASWTGKILSLMEKYEGVYADISYNTDPMDGRDAEANYFSNLKSLLAHPTYKQRILFGTDFFLVRLRLQEKHHWHYFEERFSDQEFAAIAEDNPRRFLGIGIDDGVSTENIQSYVRFIYQNRTRLEHRVPDWIHAEIRHIYGDQVNLPPPTLGTRWSWNNHAHFRTYRFMKDQLRVEHADFKFRDTGRLRMRQMQYWNKEFCDPGMWRRTLLDLSERLTIECEANQGNFEPGYDRQKSIDTFSRAFDEGDLALYELGKACDRIFKFIKEGTPA